MSYREILVQVDEAVAGRRRAEVASDLARRFGARLSGTFLRSDLMKSPGAVDFLAYLGPTEIDALVRDHAAAVEACAGKARASLDAAAGKAGVALEWRPVAGDSNGELVRLARQADLTVFPPRAVARLARHSIDAATLALDCGGPVLVVPDDWSAGSVGRRVLVAWNGSRESSRAVRDAWPFLEAAEALTVLMVSPEAESDVDLLGWLRAHGCTASLEIDRRPDAHAVDAVRDWVGNTRADLVVMGLYGRSRLREFVLGGVSRAMLDRPPAPLLLSH